MEQPPCIDGALMMDMMIWSEESGTSAPTPAAPSANEDSGSLTPVLIGAIIFQCARNCLQQTSNIKSQVNSIWQPAATDHLHSILQKQPAIAAYASRCDSLASLSQIYHRPIRATLQDPRFLVLTPSMATWISCSPLSWTPVDDIRGGNWICISLSLDYCMIVVLI